VIIVGAHYDKVKAGLGKIDNGTGSTMVANLYQALGAAETDATIVFIAFAREEEGLYGSAAYVRSLSAVQRKKIDAMINLDTLAVDGTFSWKNNSTRAVLDRLAKVSRDSGHALKEDYLNGGDADSSSFRDAGIPAVTIYGASQDVIFDTIHSERDNMSAFSLKHYKNAYLLTLETIKSLDKTPLGPVARRDI
jgi:Zn-dependent M28 family amino/carboxypeptidase